MKYLVALLMVGLSMFTALEAVRARNIKLFVSIEEALQVDDVDEKPKGLVKFYFGQKNPLKVARSIGSEIIYRKAAAMGKSEEIPCSWAFQYVLAAFEKRARELGADAVINITSFYKKVEFSSAAKFECHAGNVITGVSLRGEYVKVAQP